MSVTEAKLEISAMEHQERVEALQARLEHEELDAMCVFGPVRVSYLTGFHFAATERPIVLVVPRERSPGLLIPQIEVDHVAEQCPHLSHVVTYPEYPGGGSGKHPMYVLLDLLNELGVRHGKIAMDHDGYENRWGYRGPKLSALLESAPEEHLDLVDDLRMVKSPAEIALIEEACSWGDHAHRLMQQMIALGANELVVSHAASMQATRDMLKALGQRYVPKAREGMPAQAMFITGTNTANPHGLHQHVGVREGDVLITGAFAVVGGYESELERTLFVGEPPAAFRHYFEAMLAAQDVAFAALRPGRPCSDVEREVSTFIHSIDMGKLVRHHTGHAFGMEGHEHPFLDLDDHTEIQPGMIFSLEPGLYVPNLGGFRHSDTVLVTEHGRRNLCGYPRDLDHLTIPPTK